VKVLLVDEGSVAKEHAGLRYRIRCTEAFASRVVKQGIFGGRASTQFTFRESADVRYGTSRSMGPLEACFSSGYYLCNWSLSSRLSLSRSRPPMWLASPLHASLPEVCISSQKSTCTGNEETNHHLCEFIQM